MTLATHTLPKYSEALVGIHEWVNGLRNPVIRTPIGWVGGVDLSATEKLP
jgi:hypothetical protein